jgi:hypothetical protein
MATVAIVSDCHTNSTTALFPPQWSDDDGGGHTQNLIQHWLWDCWLDYWRAVEAMRDGDLFVVINGDMVDGNHHGTPQIVTTNMSDQAGIAIEVLKPVLDLKPEFTFFVRGTEAHVGSAAQDENMVAKLYSQFANVERQPETGSFSWWYLPLEVQGIKFDIAHHGRGGFRPWTASNAANILAAELVFDYFGDTWIPDIAIRSHVHYKSDTYDNFPIRLLYTPPWQQSTAFGHRVKPGKRSLIAGGYIFQCNNGTYSGPVKKIYEPPRDRVWRQDATTNGERLINGVGARVKRWRKWARWGAYK